MGLQGALPKAAPVSLKPRAPYPVLPTRTSLAKVRMRAWVALAGPDLPEAVRKKDPVELDSSRTMGRASLALGRNTRALS